MYRRFTFSSTLPLAVLILFRVAVEEVLGATRGTEQTTIGLMSAAMAYGGCTHGAPRHRPRGYLSLATGAENTLRIQHRPSILAALPRRKPPAGALASFHIPRAGLE